MTETIALFGATGLTGKHFFKLALESGFKVQAMVRDPAKVDGEVRMKNYDNLKLIEGDFSNKDAMTQTVKGAKYVVSMTGGPRGKPKEYPENLMLNFFTTLTGIIQEQEPKTVKLVLYQAGAFSTLPGQNTTILHNVVKTVVGNWFMGMGPNVEDNNQVISYIKENLNTLGFQTIVSRPGQLHDKPSQDELVADHFNPPNFAITSYDLAAWSLKALQDESLYGTFPYLQQVGKNILAPLQKKTEPTAEAVVQPMTDATAAVAQPVTETTDKVVEGLKNADVR